MPVYRCPRCRAEDISADAYLDRLAEADDPNALLGGDQRAAAKAPIARALDEVRQKLAMAPVDDPSR